MPFKSEAQRKKIYALEKEGKVPEGTAQNWERDTPKGKRLPLRVGRRRKTTKVIR